MSLKDNPASYKSLPLELSLNWSARLPKIIWKDFDLTPNHNTGVLDLSSMSLAEALLSIHSPIEYLEFLSLCEWLSEGVALGKVEIESLEKTFHFRWGEDAKKLLHLYKSTPPSFQNWGFLKKLKFNDLRPLLRADHGFLFPLLDAFQNLSVSKTIGCEILELLCDLSQSSKASELKTLFEDPNGDVILRKLKALQAPLSFSKDQMRKDKVREWPWPAKVKGEWKRVGDQAGLHVEIFATHPKDFELKVEELRKISSKWEKDL